MKTILIVADDLLFQRRMQLNLPRLGYNVVQALTVGDVWNQIETQQPDLIVLDMNMSDMEAYRLLPELKEKESIRTLPLIVLLEGQNDQAAIDWDGRLHYLIKPIDTAHMISTVKFMLSDFMKNAVGILA